VFATKADLAACATKADLAPLATKADVAACATKVELAETKAELIRWMFVFWVGQGAIIAGLMKFLVARI
jgi:hypothetical protein